MLNTEKYNLPQLDLGVKLPEFKIEEKYLDKYGLTKDSSDFDFLLCLCLEGLEKRIGKQNPRYNEYGRRMEIELKAFKDLNFSSYLLITWDIVNFCRESGIAIGYGRGSAANSLINYLIGITEIDSVKYNLFFERFLNKTRAKFDIKDGIKYYNGSLLFDIDLDISYSDREKLVEWIEEKYKGKIAKLPTIGTYTSKILVKEIAKSLLEIDEDEANEISESIPVQFGKVYEIDKAIKESPNFKQFADKNLEIISIAKKLYELNRHLGIHASAWIISADELNNSVPIQLSRDKNICASYVMDDALNLAIKIDLLGLRCATLIDRVSKLVNINPNTIDINDPLIYKELQNLINPYGLFQIESDCNYGVVRHVKPKNIEHLSAVVALARPGALQFIDAFAEYVNEGTFKSIHPIFDEILKETAGVCLYQEQLVAMAHKIGFSLEDGENIRRVVGKKKLDEVKEWKERVYKKVQDSKLDEKVGDIFWKILEDSASYQFNKGHSVSYATMSAATIYLKFKYPKEFFLTLLELSKEEQSPMEEIKTIENEMKYFGIKLLGPHLIKSDLGFKIEGDDIRFGISSIKGISDKTLEKLKGFCKNYSNKFQIFNAAKECNISIGILSGLIHSGCLDDYLTDSRSQTALEAATYNLLTPKREKVKIMELGEQFKYNLIAIIKYLSLMQPGEINPFIKESRLNTLRKKFKPYQDIFKQNSKNEELTNYWHEKEYLGFSYSHRLFDILKKKFPDMISIYEAKTELNETKVTIGGEISEIRTGTSKNKNKYIKISLYDGTDKFDAMMMERYFEVNNQLNAGKEFQVGDIVLLSGKKSSDIIFADRIVNQNVFIANKISQFKENSVDKNKN